MNTHRKFYLIFCFMFIVFPHKFVFHSIVVTAQSEPIYGLYAEVFNPPDEILYPMDDPDEDRDPRDGPYFQGDILNPPDARGITSLESLRWPFGQKKTSWCVQFQYWYSDLDVPDYVYINGKEKRCFSSVGRRGGRQLLNLEAPHCFEDRNMIVHELLHVLGFYHEQGRWDRDKYVGINTWNIEDGKEPNFDRCFTIGVPYDYKSIMHYHSNAFAKDPSQYTVYSKQPEGDDAHSKNERRKITESLGHGGLSEGDIKQIRLMHGCQ